MNTKIDKYIIMPNHIHIIIGINGEPKQQQRSLISKMVGYLKMNTSKQMRLQNKFLSDVWQRSYHDHIIRNKQEYQKIWEYID